MIFVIPMIPLIHRFYGDRIQRVEKTAPNLNNYINEPVKITLLWPVSTYCIGRHIFQQV